jgi:hypothetical protein
MVMPLRLLAAAGGFSFCRWLLFSPHLLSLSAIPCLLFPKFSLHVVDEKC